MNKTLFHVVPQLVVLFILLRSVKAGWVSGTGIGLRLPNRPMWPYIAIYAFYTLGLEAFGLLRGSVHTGHWTLPSAEIGIRIIGIVLLAPIIEEWIFRGVLLQFLNRHLSFGLSNLLQSMAFFLLHVPDLIAGPSTIVDGMQVFGDALFFGWARDKTQSLYPGMTAHAFGNSLAVLERIL